MQNLRLYKLSTTNFQFSAFNFQFKKSHVVTKVPRQAVECEARNPCILDRTDIKVLKARQRIFLSCLQHFDLFGISSLQGFRTACFITCLETAVPSELLKIPQFLIPSYPQFQLPTKKTSEILKKNFFNILLLYDLKKTGFSFI